MTGRPPVRELGRRAPEQGRVRTGAKSVKGFPTKLESFRFTSSDEQAIRAIAEKYGGEAVEWKGAPTAGKQWEVFTPLARIGVVLPPDAIGDGVQYEAWKGGYCVRRCDGEICDQPQDTPDGTEMVPGPCLCANEKGAPLCKGKLRLNVILRDIPFGGTWRLETSSEHALRELPGMIDLIYSIQDSALTSAVLVLDQRTKVAFVKGKAQTRNYGVPMLAIDNSLDEIVGGAAALGSYSSPAALGQGAAPAQPLPSERGPESSDDDDIFEAEIVDPISDEQHEALVEVGDIVAASWNAEHPEESVTTQALLQALAGQVTGVSGARVVDLDVGHGKKIGDLLRGIVENQIEFKGIREGRAKVRRL